jgi:hypothetical protein
MFNHQKCGSLYHHWGFPHEIGEDPREALLWENLAISSIELSNMEWRILGDLT